MQQQRLAASTLFVLGWLFACQRTAPRATIAATIRVDSATLTVNGTQLFYEAAGSGPPVVLIHGGNLDRRMWDPQFLALAEDHRVIRYDARGFGRSAPASTPFAAHEDLMALLGALQIPRASFVGLSMGGRIAIDFALAHPTMVDRLVLASPGLSGWQFAHADTTWFAEARAARDRGDSTGVALAWLGSDFMRPAMQHAELVAPLRSLAGANGRYWMALLRHGDQERVASPTAFHHTDALRAPTLLIIGSGDTSDIINIGDTLAATVPGLRRVVFEGAGHMVNMEQAARFTELVRQFLHP